MKTQAGLQCRTDRTASSVQQTNVTSTAELSGFSANELAVRAQGGCGESFRVLTDRYRPRLIRFIDQRVARNTVADAEDVAQEVLTKAWHSLPSFRPRYQFATWLYTIAARTATDHRRRSRRGEVYPQLESLPDRKRSHEQCVDSNECVENIWSIATRVLKPDQFDAMWLRYGEDLPVKEIAQVMGKTSVGIRVLLHRARCMLQPHLEKYVREDTNSETSTENATCSDS